MLRKRPDLRPTTAGVLLIPGAAVGIFLLSMLLCQVGSHTVARAAEKPSETSSAGAPAEPSSVSAPPDARSAAGPAISTPSPAGPTSARPLDALIAESKEGLKTGEYDEATRDLKQVIARAQDQPSVLSQGYLLLIKADVMRGNYYKSEPEGRDPSELFYREAERSVVDCLSIHALRHIKPEPVVDYPPEMVALFQRVRSESFGSIRLLHLNPPDAAVIFEGDTLHAAAGDSTVELDDLPLGPHTLVIGREGYRSLTDRITVAPGSVTEKSYELSRRRGALWYTERSGVAVAGAVTYLVLRRHDSANSSTPPLSGPPAAPSTP